MFDVYSEVYCTVEQIVFYQIREYYRHHKYDKQQLIARE